MSVKPRPAEERFHLKTIPGPSGCIDWTGSVNSSGYGTFYAGPGDSIVAHRWAYTHSKGPIPIGMYLDHLCRNRRCVNPDHLEPVSQRENLLRGDTVIARSVGASHCPSGHPYSGEHLYITPSTGHRRCRTCRRNRDRQRREEEN